jgi:hypothetical protein
VAVGDGREKETCGRSMSGDVRLLGYLGLAPQIVPRPFRAMKRHGRQAMKPTQEKPRISNLPSSRASALSPQLAGMIADLFVAAAKLSAGTPRLFASTWRGAFAIQSDSELSE